MTVCAFAPVIRLDGLRLPAADCSSSLESSAEPWHLLHVRHEEEAEGEDDEEEDGVVVPLVADAVDIG